MIENDNKAGDDGSDNMTVRENYLNQKNKPKDAIEKLKSPNFDFWEDTRPWVLLHYLEEMFIYLKFMDYCKISVDILRTFLCDVYESYPPNSYHNFNHCFCVSQMMFLFIMQLEWLSLDNRFVLYLSAVCHDLGHPGTNNKFQADSKSVFFEKYSAKSTLERHHAHLAKELFIKEGLLTAFEESERERIIYEVQTLILATDMARHKEILESFKEIVGKYDRTIEKHRELLMLILVKSSDISNEGRPFNVTEQWCNCLLKEFFEQGDMEKKMGVPVSPGMDRDTVERNKSQIFFLSTFSIPLFEILNKVVDVSAMLGHMKRNKEEYVKRLASIEVESKKEKE